MRRARPWRGDDADGGDARRPAPGDALGARARRGRSNAGDARPPARAPRLDPAIPRAQIVYYTTGQYYEITNGTLTLALEEVFDTSDDMTMETANLWHLAKKFHDYGAVLFAFWVPLFAGVLAPLAIFLHLYGVFFHNSRERMSRKFELVHGMGRMGFSYPIFVALFAAVVGFKGATSDDTVIDNSSDTEEIVIGAEWDVRILAKICHGAPYFAGVLCAAQLLARFIYVIGRTERPIPSVAEIRARIRHEPSWSLRSRTAERRGRARRRGFTAIPLLVSLLCLAYGLYEPSVDTSVTFELDLALVTDRAAKESEIPNFKGSYLGRFPLVSADSWTSDHLSERSRSVDVFSVTRARGTLTLKRRRISLLLPR